MGTLQEFASSLAARSDAELLRLFALRPDAITPPVATFADLASRLSTTASINAALDQLNLPVLRVLAAPPADGFPAGGLPELGWLHELALVFRASPASFPAHLPALKHDAGTPLFLPLTAVALALSSEESPPCSTLPDLPDAPKPRLTPVSPSLRDNAVGSAVETLLRTVSELLEVVGHAGSGHPGASDPGTGVPGLRAPGLRAFGLSALRDGTLGVRPVRELAKALSLETQSVHFYLELAAAANLISFDAASRCWRTHDLHDHEGCTLETTWRSLARDEQWFVLVQSWLDNPRPPSALLKPLAPHDPPRQARQWRRQLVMVMASLTAGSAAPSSAAPDVHSVLDALSWHHPRQTAALSHELPDLLHELEWLGITGAGALSSPGRAAVRGEAALAPATMRALLPDPVENFVLQGDLTAISPGFLLPEIASTLKLMAVPEGRGAAGIFRFSQHSLEFTAASGLSRTDVLDFLQQHSSTAVPQSLEFLIAEVFRNRPGATSSASPSVPSSVPPSAPSAPPSALPTLAATRRPVAHKTQPGNGVVHEETQLLALAQLKRLRSHPVWANDGVGESGPALAMEELRRALGRGDLLRVQVVDGAGEIEELLLQPVSLVAGTLRASLPGTSRERRLSIHRIISAVPQGQESDGANTTTGKELHG